MGGSSSIINSGIYTSVNFDATGGSFVNGVSAGTVVSSRLSTVPEPGVNVLLAGFALVGTGIFARRRFRRK